jgi:ribose transport system permease protein
MKSITRQEWYGALVAVIVLSVLLTFASPYFLTTGNLSNILVQASVIALLAGGQTFVILTGGVDLAVGALAALAGAVAGHMMIKMGIDPYWAMGVALVIGAAVGVFNGYLVAFVGIPAFIVTLGGLTLWRGLAFDLTGGFDNAGLPDPLPFIGYGDVLGVPMPTLITLSLIHI